MIVSLDKKYFRARYESDQILSLIGRHHAEIEELLDEGYGILAEVEETHHWFLADYQISVIARKSLNPRLNLKYDQRLIFNKDRCAKMVVKPFEIEDV